MQEPVIHQPPRLSPTPSMLTEYASQSDPCEHSRESAVTCRHCQRWARAGAEESLRIAFHVKNVVHPDLCVD